MNRCWGNDALSSNHTHISLHGPNTDDHGQMSQAALASPDLHRQDSLIKNATMPRTEASQITVEKNKVVVIVWCVYVCLCGSVSDHK